DGTGASGAAGAGAMAAWAGGAGAAGSSSAAGADSTGTGTTATSTAGAGAAGAGWIAPSNASTRPSPGFRKMVMPSASPATSALVPGVTSSITWDDTATTENW